MMPSLPIKLRADSDYMEEAMETKKESFLFKRKIAFTKNEKQNVKGYTNLVYGPLLPTFSPFSSPFKRTRRTLM